MKKTDLLKYTEIFKSETREYLSQLNQFIVNLEKSPEDRGNIDAIFRNFHTIKGMAGTMGYKLVETLSHSLEDLLSLVRSGDLSVTSDIIDTLLTGTDKIEELVETNNNEDEDVEELIRGISDIGKGKVSVRKKKILGGSLDNINLEISLDENTPLKGARATVLISDIMKMAEIVDFSPSKNSIENGEFKKNFSLTLIPRISPDKIKESILAYSDVKSVSFANEESKTNIAKDILKKSDIRVGIEKLNKLQNLLSELVISKESLKAFVRTEETERIVNETERIANIISSLQDEVVKIRMVPIWQVFERFPRVIRDTAKALGKKINFEIKGKNIELDRSMLENLAEPLLHLLRNAIYHGIETREDRKRLGKTEEGHLVLEAERQRGRVLIKVWDDGKGMDIEKIGKKALAMGLISQDKLASLGEREILDFVFVSGFTTSLVVDEVSGRGVGLDVVKTRMRTLGGTFEFKTTKNKGTLFILKVPLTMAIIKAFLVRIEDETFAIPLTFVEETIEVEHKSIKTVHSKELFILRDEVIPIKRLHKIFNIKNGKKKDFYPAVIVNSESRKVALVASEFLEHTDIVVKTLPRTLTNIKEFAGVTLLSDGKPALILDVPNIV